MKIKFLSVVLCTWMTYSFAQTIQLSNITSSVFCSSGKDTVQFAVDYAGIPANSNIVFYQSSNANFNPYLGQGDSIGFINVGGNTSNGTQTITACPEILGIFIDACNPAPLVEQDNEYIVMTSGKGFMVNNLQVDLPANRDINMPLGSNLFGTPSAALMTQLRIGSCNPSTLLSAGPGDSIPPNAIVIIFPSVPLPGGGVYNYNFSSYCSSGQPIYILQNSYHQPNGSFANNPPASCPNALRSTIIKNRTCSSTLTYNPCTLPPYDASNPNANDGNYVVKLPNNVISTTTNGGIRNNASDLCNGLRFDSIVGSTIIKYPIPNDGGHNATTNFCNTGIHYIKAITHPNGSQPISNTIQFQLVCLDVSTNVNSLSICSGDKASVNISSSDPNATISWSVSGGTAITGASAGTGSSINQQLTYTGTTKDSLTYLITASDATCTKTTSVKVVVNKCSCTIPFSFGTSTTSVCAGGNITLDASTAYDSYVWSTGATSHSIIVTQPGKYWIDVYKNGCKGTDTINVVQITKEPKPNLGNDITTCSPVSQTLTTGNANTTWYLNTNSVPVGTGANYTATQFGTYIAKVSNSCGDVFDTIRILQSNSLPPFNLGNDTTYCGTFSRVLSTGNATTVWSTGVTAAAITVSAPGTYYATISGNCGSVSDTIVITQTNGINFSFGATSTAVCQGGNITLDASTAYNQYIWNTGATTHSIVVTQPGKYWVDVFKNGCKGSDSIQVMQITKPNKPNLGRDTTFCGPFSYILTTGDAQTQWYRGQTLLGSGINYTATQIGTYIAKITNSCGVASDTIVISGGNALTVNLGRDTAICKNASIVLDATTAGNNISYTWSTGAVSPKITVNQFGKYDVVVSNGICTVKDTIFIDIIDFPTILSLGNDTTYCGPFSATLFTGDANTIWNTGVKGTSITVSQPGTYIAENKNQCGSAKDTIILKQYPKPPVALGKDTTICDSIILNIGNGNYTSVSWNTGETSSSILVNKAGIYKVTVSDAHCSNSDSIVIKKDCFYDVYIPTAFSPNSDGHNDIFVPLSNIKGMQILDLLIYNRWGEKVFEAQNFAPNDSSKGWNGYFKGEPAQVDNYVYYITVKMPDDKIKVYKGTFALLR